MVSVTAKNLTNSPFILYDVNDDQVMYPAMGSAEVTADLPADQVAILQLFDLVGGVVETPSSAPVNTSAPVLSGTARVGQELTVTTGSWSGNPAPTFTRQWKRGSANVGSGGLTYTLVAADAGAIMTCVVTATNSEGSTSATSSATSAVTQTPANTVAPALTGTAQVGSTLTITNGTWSGSPIPTYARQWKRGASDVGTGASTYTIIAADAGQIMTCVVTATNSAGSASATSNATAAVTSIPANTAVPTITGTAQVGATLTTTNGTWTGSPAPTYARQWKAGGADISGATATTYVPTEGDVGKTITVTVTATNSAGSASATSAATAAVIEA